MFWNRSRVDHKTVVTSKYTRRNHIGFTLYNTIHVVDVSTFCKKVHDIGHVDIQI